MARQLDKLRKDSESSINKLKSVSDISAGVNSTLDNHLEQVQGEYHRVTELSHNAASVIDEIDREFKRVTKLQNVDIAFLFVATALQCARQYLLTPMTQRVGDQEAAHEVKGNIEEHSNRSHRLYNPSLEEIITNPVPFDASTFSNGALQGGSHLGHRATAIGHDPLLGLVFGTANIATSTLTTWKMDSYHIKTGLTGAGVRDVFSYHAQTSQVLSRTFRDKLLHEGIQGKTIVGVSVAKEIQHLRSDVYSTKSLPLPVISVINPEFAGELAKRGFDMANVLDVGKQFVFAYVIDTLIALIHSFFYDPSTDYSQKAFEVRTRKILLYSNLLATTSNVIVSFVADKRFIDWGGYINTLRHIAFDLKFIAEVKRDFLKNELYDRIVGKEYDFMEGK